jgi:hypothetical protein
MREGYMNNRISATVTGAVVGLAGAAQAAAQTRIQDAFLGGDDGTGDIASAGNGGVATSSASGGAVSVGDINSGGNVCNAIGIGDTWGGPVGADGGSCLNTTALDITANGGTAIADASGGDYNLAFVS